MARRYNKIKLGNIIKGATATLVTLLTLPKTHFSFDPESRATHKEMLDGETQVEVFTPESFKEAVNSPIPTLVTFTSRTCDSCMADDYQIVILADNYAKKRKNVRFGAMCIEEHTPALREFDIHAIPEIRLYYKGMYQMFELGTDFTLLDRWIQGHLDFEDIHFIKSTKKFWKIVGEHHHALIWYGEDLRDKNHVFQDFMRCIFFRFSHHFFVLASDSKEIGEKFELEWDSFYEYNKFDGVFRKIDIEHLYEGKKNLDMGIFHRVADFIERNSFRDVTLWNVDWMKTHHQTSSLIFYYKSLSKDHKNFEGMDEKELGDMRMFNETCGERLFNNVHCLIVDHEDMKTEKLDNIYHVSFDALPETALVLVRYMRTRREIFVHNIKEDGMLEREELLKFVEDGMNERIPQFHTLNEQLPEDNENRRVKVVNSETMHQWLINLNKDSFVLVHDGMEAQDTRAMMYKFHRALKYIFDHLTEEQIKKLLEDINIGILDCEKNDCYYTSDVGEHPTAAYFKPWRFTGTASVYYKDFNQSGDIVTHFFHTYSGSVEIKEWPRDIKGFVVPDDKVHFDQDGNWSVDQTVELEIDL